MLDTTTCREASIDPFRERRKRLERLRAKLRPWGWHSWEGCDPLHDICELHVLAFVVRDHGNCRRLQAVIDCEIELAFQAEIARRGIMPGWLKVVTSADDLALVPAGYTYVGYRTNYTGRSEAALFVRDQLALTREQYTA